MWGGGGDVNVPFKLHTRTKDTLLRFAHQDVYTKRAVLRTHVFLRTCVFQTRLDFFVRCTFSCRIGHSWRLHQRVSNHL